MDSYPFELDDVNFSGADEYLLKTFVYHFDSVKSHHHYVVHIENYVQHLYCVKFYDESTDISTGKFDKLSSTFEARKILRTITNICLDMLKGDSDASFFFVGSTDRKDVAGKTSRRFRVYQTYVRNMGYDEMFFKSFLDNYSSIVLVNLKAVSDIDAYLKSIRDFIV